MKVTFELADVENIIYSALCNAGSYIAGAGLQLTYIEKEYQAAKRKLLRELKKDSICFEDALRQMLKDGKVLKFTDTEGGGEYTRELTLNSAMKNLNTSKIKSEDMSRLMEVLDADGNADAWDDYINIQYCLFGKQIFA